MPAEQHEQSTRERILSVCVKLFLQKGYQHTTVADITHMAGVSNSSFQHFFGHKDGVLLELIRFMYDSQFATADTATASSLPPAYAYAVETAVQLAICDLSPTLCELYLESYTHQETLDYIQHATATRLHEAFGAYQPELGEDDFYALDIGTSALMRGYMAHPHDRGLSLERRVRGFLTLALRGLAMPETEVQQVIAFVMGLDLRGIARQVVQRAVHDLAAHYEVSLTGVLNLEEPTDEVGPVSTGEPRS